MREVIKDRTDVMPSPVRFTYKPMSVNLDDVYATDAGLLDKVIRSKLRQKRLPIPPQFADPSFTNDNSISTSNGSSTSMTCGGGGGSDSGGIQPELKNADKKQTSTVKPTYFIKSKCVIK
uniref:SNF1 protein kinase subunit beta-1 n=1 Tax=Lygus hesperus TaxID=30085 RepID=A0A0A9WJI0_LYGHE